MLTWTGILYCIYIAIEIGMARPVGRCLLGRRVRASKVEKFGQSFMEVLFYSGSFILGFLVVQDQAWVWPSESWWQNHVISGKGSQLREANYEVRFFYVLYCCRYMQGLISVFFREHRRKDYIGKVIHHLATVLVIIMSFSFDYIRVGCVIMVLLDAGDPPLHLAKMCKYVSEVRGPNQHFWSSLADLFFGTFALVFTFTRMGCYGYTTWSATVEIYRVVAPGLSWADAVVHVGFRPVACWLLLWVLMALQVFWEWQLVKAIYKILTQGDLVDTRSASDTDDNKSS